MNDKKRGLGRIALYLTVIGALVVSILPASSQSAAAQQQNCRRFTVAGQNYDVCGRILEEWSKHGNDQANVYVNGLPITNVRSEISLTDGKTYQVQWFERARFELHPENRPPYDVLLGLLGVMKAEGRGSIDPNTRRVRNPADQPFVGIDRPADADGRTKVWFPETRHTISGKILEYWNRYGGLKQFGFPLSEPFQEVSVQDGKTYTVQYFERNRFELHPEKQPPYEVELGLLGVEQYKTVPIPADQLPISPPKNVTTTKDTLVFAMSQEPASLFPLFENAAVAGIASAPLYIDLIGRDHKDQLYPAVAWYVPTLENGGAFFTGFGEDQRLVVKYKLRRGIKWNDGTEVTSRDALYFYKLILDPNATIQDRTLYEKLYNVDNPDKYTVIYNFMSYAQARDFYNGTTDKQHFAFLKDFVDQRRPVVDPLYDTVGAILPDHILSKIPADKILESEFARNPQGGGPFRVVRWDSGSQIVLEQNPNYNLTDKPLLRRIVIRIIADTNQIIAQLRTGELDAATSDAFPAPTEVLNQVDALPTQKVEYVPARVWEHIDFNLDRPFFADKNVRKAIAHAINRQRIIDQVVLGRSIILHTFLPPASWASMQNPDFAQQWQSRYPLTTYNYDVNRANQLLDQAGWVRGSDGIRAKGGVKLSFEYATTAGNRTREQITQLIAADLRAVGIEARLRYIPAAQYFGDDGYLARRQHDFAQYAWILGVDPGNSCTLYHSEFIPSADNAYSGSNYPGYRNAEYDRLCNAVNNEIDRTKRAPILAQLQQIWSDDLPAIPLYPRLNIEVHKENLVGWDVSGGTVYSTYKSQTIYFR
jgi:peptide/nickel transport system substrate-binding protein